MQAESRDAARPSGQPAGVPPGLDSPRIDGSAVAAEVPPARRSFIPHSVVILFVMLLVAAALSHVIPAGAYDRIDRDGRAMVLPDSFRHVDPTPVGPFDLFRALPRGFRSAVDIVFIVLASGILYGFLEASGAVENGVGTLVRKLGRERRTMIIVVMTLVYSSVGVFMGLESSIGLIPFAALFSLAVGGDLVLAAGISVAGVAIGFGLSPVNIYTVGTGHKLAELPLFSGALLRSALCLAAVALLAWYNVRYFRRISREPRKSFGLGLDRRGLSLSRPISDYCMTRRQIFILSFSLAGLGLKLWGVFVYRWSISDVAALYCAVAAGLALFSSRSANECGDIVLNGVATVAPGAFMVGYASSIKEVLAMGGINDTIAHHFASSLDGLGLYSAALGMTLVQCAMNFLIPSGSGQALATLPVMIPVGDVLGLTRQTTILAFQVGDGVTNLVNPALGGLVAMLSVLRVPLVHWLQFIGPYFVAIMLLALAAVMTSVAVDYGPF